MPLSPHVLMKVQDTWQAMEHRQFQSSSAQPCVVFTNGSILVVRARFFCVFDEPRMVSLGNDLHVIHPCVSTSFGWIDGVPLTSGDPASQPPLSLLFRAEGHDPWIPTDQVRFLALNTDFTRTGPHTSMILLWPHKTRFHLNLIQPFSSSPGPVAM